jgi:hypothetical protein
MTLLLGSTNRATRFAPGRRVVDVDEVVRREGGIDREAHESLLGLVAEVAEGCEIERRRSLQRPVFDDTDATGLGADQQAAVGREGERGRLRDRGDDRVFETRGKVWRSDQRRRIGAPRPGRR